MIPISLNLEETLKTLSLVLSVLFLIGLTACGATPVPTPTPAPTSTPTPTTVPTATPTPAPSASPTVGQITAEEERNDAAEASTGSAAGLRRIVLGMGFIPNVQFAPFYVADAKGYFAQEGLEIEFNYGMEVDLLKLIGTQKLQFAIGSGDQVILARAQDLPAVYVANFYRKFPVNVMSLAENNIVAPQDLEGKRVGIPCLCGASYVGWQALAYATGIDSDQVDLQVIGFTQASAVERGLVDAAVDYIVNGPVQLRLAGHEVNEIAISEYIDLVSNGIITNEQTIQKEPELVQGMVRAFLRGLRDTLENPEEVLEITFQYVPEAGGENKEQTEAVLRASIKLWQGEGLGMSKRENWVSSQDFMHDVGLIDRKTAVDNLFTNEFVEKAELDETAHDLQTSSS